MNFVKAVVQTIRLFGPTVGYYLASYALTLYVDPDLTPLITNSDPRWIGAWWYGEFRLDTLWKLLIQV